MCEPPKITKAVIPAAGFGTRMLPATKALPKEMLPVAGKPLVQYAVEEAAASGIETVILVVRSCKSPVQAHFAPDPLLESFLEGRQLPVAAALARSLAKLADLQFVEQHEPLGLAHAIYCARELLKDEPFVVLLPDVIMVNDPPVTRQLILAYQRQGGSFLAMREVEPQDLQRHGVVQVEDAGDVSRTQLARVTKLVEKPSVETAPSRLGVFGRYLLEPFIWDSIANTKPDAHGEIQLTEALNLLCKNQPLFGLCFTGQHYDAGDHLGYLKANLELSLRDPHLRPFLLDYLSQIRA